MKQNMNFGKQTLASSIKTRSITKNNYFMPKIQNKKFMPVNKSQAKEDVYRTLDHSYEFAENLEGKENNRTRHNNSLAFKSLTNFEKGLSDPFFASRLDKMGKLSYHKMMYQNPKRVKESLYDYQKIQSTA
jgi:hypothetical protein